MKRNQAMKKNKPSRGGKRKGDSLYKRKKEFLARVRMWGWEFPIGEKPWK